MAEVRTGRATRVLGVFAYQDTFWTGTEEALRAAGAPAYFPGVPTIAEMSTAALTILKRNPRAQRRGFFAVIEEEGTDNFGNSANASASFEAGARADEALGVLADFVATNDDTLLITTADTSAGNKAILSGPVPTNWEQLVGAMSPAEFRRAMNIARPFNSVDGRFETGLLDGVGGAATWPFLSAPDRNGRRIPFFVGWATRNDIAGAVVARAKGYNAKLVSELGVVDNTDIYRIMYYTLFDRWLTGVGTHRPLPRQRDK